MTAAGLALGAAGMILTASLVQAEDDAGIRSFFIEEAARKAQRPSAIPQANAYAPAANGWRLPLARTATDGRIAQPAIDLNPFRRNARKTAQRQSRTGPLLVARTDTLSGAANVAQTICVRLCDGFHAPLGHLRASSDLKAHQELCQAMNPGLPVKVFTVAAGAGSIDNAVAADGQRYGALPTAYSHETTANPACRPTIARAGEQRVSVLRDITLRPGDSIVLDGKVSTFMGGSSWPYSRRDFRDFRSAPDLTKAQRQQIDEQVGISRMEAQARSLRRQMRIREASLEDDTVMSDALLRGSFDPSERGPVRMIPIALASP